MKAAMALSRRASERNIPLTFHIQQQAFFK